MNLCIFPGTFNPIHNGHLYMADYVVKNFDINKVLFIPSYIPPQKTNYPELALHRFKMVQLATEANPHFEVSNIEYRLHGKSYTYLTVIELHRIYKIERKIKFIIGTDAFENLDSWYESENLRKLVEFIVFVRKNNFDERKYDYMKDKGYNFTFATMEFNDISSSEIRKNIAMDISVKEMLPATVERYIKENGLYKNL